MTAPNSIEAVLVDLQAQIKALNEKVDSLKPLRLLSVQDAAKALGVSAKTIRRQVQAGKLRSVRVGNRIRVNLSEV